MMGYYINFRFRELTYGEDFYAGIFEAEDNGVFCRFRYDRLTKTYHITDSSHPVRDILPLPVWWLDSRLEENGMLRPTEARTCF